MKARTFGFTALAGASALAVVFLASRVEGHVVLTAEGGAAGVVADGPDGAPIVAPLPGHPTLDDLVRAASGCSPHRTRFLTLTFRPDGYLRSLHFDHSSKGDECVKHLFDGARVAPFAGPDRVVKAAISY